MVQGIALPDLNAKAVKLPARKQRVNYNDLSQGDKKPTKVKVPARFKIGDTIMTKEGAALVHSMGKKGIIQVTWPNHHSAPPAAIYNIPAEDVWTQAEKPNLVYDSRGTRIHEVNNVSVEWKRIHAELVDPNDVIGKVPADEIILPKSYKDKWTSVYLHLINEAED